MYKKGDGQVKLVLLDRDGVLNADRPDYVKNASEFRMLPGAAEAVAKLSKRGFHVAVVSNQAGVGKMLISEESLWQISSLLELAVESAGGAIERFYYCKHTPEDNCNCRKPRPGLILQACKDMGVKPSDCYFVGDAERDVLAARSSGCKSVLVLTGFTRREDVEKFEQKPDYVANDLREAADWIIGRENAD